MIKHKIIWFLIILLPLLFGCENDFSSAGPGDPAVTWPQGLTAHPEHTLADISLDSHTNDGIAGTFTWDCPVDTPVGALGVQSHRVIFTPDDTEKYNTVTGDVDVLVSLVALAPIKAGTFRMGEPNLSDSYPLRYVTLTKDYYIGRYEVTQKQWYEVMGKTIEEQQAASTSWTNDYGRGDNYPVYYIRWCEAIIFCNRLSILEGLSPAYRMLEETDPDEWEPVPTTSTIFHASPGWMTVEIVAGSNGYRLPTEAQWEYAARAGTTTIWYGGDTSAAANIGDYAWYADNSDGKMHEVGLKQPNAWGLYDMIGNVNEFLWDRRDAYIEADGYNRTTHYYRSEAAKIDPMGLEGGVPRGLAGGYYASAAGSCNLSQAGNTTYPFQSFNYTGFRVMRPAQ